MTPAPDWPLELSGPVSEGPCIQRSGGTWPVLLRYSLSVVPVLHVVSVCMPLEAMLVVVSCVIGHALEYNFLQLLTE